MGILPLEVGFESTEGYLGGWTPCPYPVGLFTILVG